MNEQSPPERFIHPVSGAVIWGHRVTAGTVLRETDVYDSSSGAWEPCPCPGLTFQGGNHITWVSPS